MWLAKLSWFFVFLIFLIPHLWMTQLTQNFVYPKVIVLDFAIAFAALGLAFFDQWQIPHRKLYSYLLLGLAGTKLFATLMNWNWVTAYSAVGAASFVLLALFIQMAWQKFELKMDSFNWPIIISLSVLFVFVAIQFYNSRYIGMNPEPVFFSGPFGNINMMCEYLVFLLPWLMFAVKRTKGLQGHLLALVTYFSLTILLVGQSRSVLMGIALVFLYEAIKGMDRRQWIIYALAGLTYLGTQSLPTAGLNYEQSKQGSLAKRKTLYVGASKMLLDHPLGIGGAEFEYTYIPYQLSSLEDPVEREKFNTPHNEFFKWGIENGWAFLLIALAFLGLTLKDVWKIGGSEDDKTFYRTAFLVLFPQMTFQFPFENPASYFLMALSIALIFSKIPQKSWALPKWGKALMILIAVGLFAKAGTQTYSKWIESVGSKDREAMSVGCPIDRTNWRLCFFYSLSLLEGHLDESFENTKIQLFQRPFDFHALRALGFYYISRNDRINACEATQAYNTFFKGKSYFSQFIQDNCKANPNPVPYENSSQFYNSYLNWLGKKFITK